MARSESRTKTAIWSDQEFRGLSQSAERVYWMLYSQPTISLCGVVALTVRRWASNARDTTPESTEEALAELQRDSYIVVDFDTEEVLVRTFAFHDGVHKNQKTWPAAWRQLGNISSAKIRDAAEAELRKIADPPSGIPLPDRPSDRPSHSPPDRPIPLGITTAGAEEDSPYSSSPSLHPVPSPSSSSSLPSPGATAPMGTGASHGVGRRNQRDMASLADRMASVCTGTSRRLVTAEAAAVVAWASEAVDLRLVDEVIGWADEQDPESRPTLPRALAAILLKKARDAKIPMRPFIPKTRPA